MSLLIDNSNRMYFNAAFPLMRRSRFLGHKFFMVSGEELEKMRKASGVMTAVMCATALALAACYAGFKLGGLSRAILIEVAFFSSVISVATAFTLFMRMSKFPIAEPRLDTLHFAEKQPAWLIAPLLLMFVTLMGIAVIYIDIEVRQWLSVGLFAFCLAAFAFFAANMAVAIRRQRKASPDIGTMAGPRLN